MKEISIIKTILLLFLCFFSKISFGQEGILYLSAEKIVERIQRENIKVLIDRGSVLQAFHDISIERANFFPLVGLELGQRRTRSVAVGTNLSGVIPPTVSMRFDGALAGRVDLLNARNIANYVLAKKEHNITKLDHEQFRQEVINESLVAYFGYLRQLKRKDVIDSAIARDDVLLELAQSQYEAGVAHKIDVTRANTALASDKKIRLQYASNLYTSELHLKKVLNIDFSQPIKITGEKEFSVAPFDRGRLPISKVWDKRYDVQSARKTLVKNKYTQKTAFWDYIPTISADGNWGYASEKTFDAKKVERWGVGLKISMPLFDGFRILTNHKKAKILVKTQESIIRELKNFAQEEYSVAFRNHQLFYEQIDLSRESLTLSYEELELAKSRFEFGVSDNRDVVDAQAKLAKAQDDLYQSIYEYNLSRLALAKASGNVVSVIR